MMVMFGYSTNRFVMRGAFGRSNPLSECRIASNAATVTIKVKFPEGSEESYRMYFESFKGALVEMEAVRN